MNYSYQSGENITKIQAGRPLFLRTPNSKFSLPNFMLTQLYAAFAPLQVGMDILVREENVQTDVMVAQGGLFRTPVVGQQVLANALNIPITVMSTAGEGGPWGMAVLAGFANQQITTNLEDFLDQEVFHEPESMTLSPEPERVAGYQKFIKRYQEGLPVVAAAGEAVND